jgi:hypothetical protein
MGNRRSRVRRLPDGRIELRFEGEGVVHVFKISRESIARALHPVRDSRRRGRHPSDRSLQGLSERPR